MATIGFVNLVLKCRYLNSVRLITFGKHRSFSTIRKFDLDYNFLLNPRNAEEIEKRTSLRKSKGDIYKVLELHDKIKRIDQTKFADVEVLEQELIYQLSLIPNKAHPEVLKNNLNTPVVIETVGEKKEFNFPPKNFLALSKNLFQTSKLTFFCEDRSYYMMKELAELEQALISYTINKLLAEGFTLLSVPDILHSSVLEGCGMNTKVDTAGTHNQVYTIDPKWAKDMCLSGTAEVALAGYFMDSCLDRNDLPQLVASVSRCFRPEANEQNIEKDLFRVHVFNKVEMFGVTGSATGEESDILLEKFVNIQKSLFSELGLHFKILDMPISDLGASAYRKFDIEAWLPGRKQFIEISSASNCTDYQSRRLNIKYNSSGDNGQLKNLKHTHTVNGTACATPRILMSIFENFQNKNGKISVPEVLQKYMNGQMTITPRTRSALAFLTKKHPAYKY